MLPNHSFMSTPQRALSPTIKIKSPKSNIKVYKLNYNEGMQKISPELSSKVSSTQNSNNDMNKITQAWNRLKISALSKAVAMGPEVGPCSIGPNSVPFTDLDCGKSDISDTEKLDLRNAVTSTPVKSKKLEMKTKPGGPTPNENNSLDVSEIKPRAGHFNSVSEEIKELESLNLKCLNKIEEQIRRSAQKKKDDCLRLWLENDEKIKEKLAALKIELDKERLVRVQQHYIEAQRIVMESEENALLKSQELQQCKVDHEKRIEETGKKILLIEQKRKELEEKQKQKREELKHCVDGIYEMQRAYGHKYNQITEMTKKCKDMRMLNEKVSGELPRLKAMNEALLKLVEKCKEGKVVMKDLNSAKALVQQIIAVGELFARSTDEINKSVEKAEEDKKNELIQNEQKAKQEAVERQQKAKEEGERAENENIKKAQKAARLSAGIEDCISGASLKWHLELNKYLEDYERSLLPLLTDDSLKKFRLDCQKVVNVPVNAISPLDDLHLEDKLYKLSRLLQGQATPLGNTLFMATGHPLGVPFCTNLLAKKFVKQGEYSVSSKPEAAFAIAAVIVALWVDFPDFGRLLLAHFHRECPYLIPAFLPQVEGQADEDYYRMLGYQYSEDGKVEPQDKFLRRMSGMMRLYAAILVTPLKRSQLADGKSHPHNMREAWRWFAATLNLRPRPDISPTLIFDFLEVTGWMFFHVYGLQFTKLLHVLCADYFMLIQQVTPDGCGGPVVRLKSFLEKVLKEGQVPLPSGLLPVNFW